MTSFRRLLSGVMGMLLLASLALLTSPGSASADVYYTTINTRVNGMCLDNPGGSTSNHTKIQIYYCNGGLNQQWNWVPGSTPGYGALVNAASGKCLDIPDSSPYTQIIAQQYTCTGGANQQWNIEPVTGYIRVQHSGQCLSVQSYANKASVFQANCGSFINSWNVYT